MACNPATGIRGDLTTSLTLLLGMLMAQCGFAQQNRDVDTSGFQTDFAETNDQWVMTNPSAWKWEDGRLRLSVKQSEYLPSVRSPRHIAWLKDKSFGGFQLDVRALSTEPDYDHRDVCIFFGGQGPNRFYYVHFGKKTDPHANQIFIVNDAPRTKISLTTTEGTPWDDQWHHLRVVRDIETGDIRVYFDDMTQPAMTACDRTFLSGSIGLGSFDDTADFDDLTVQQ